MAKAGMYLKVPSIFVSLDMSWPIAFRNMEFVVDEPLQQRILALFSWKMIAGAWLPLLLITALHYLTNEEHHWFHDILRRLYYLPIILASFLSGLSGGFTVAVAISLLYSPHAFSHLMHMDPANTLEKSLELLLYLVVGSITGVLVDRERQRQGQLQKALKEQQSMSDQLIRAGRLSALGELVAGIAHEIKNPL